MLQNKSNLSSILLTLAYSDIFDYPLKEEEIKKFQIQNGEESKESKGTKVSKGKKTFESFVSFVPFVSSGIQEGFYCLKGREEIIQKRIFREHISEKKAIFAKKIAAILKHIPTIKLIALSGSLAMFNADIDHDIDVFIITQKKTLWTTRFAVLFILQLAGVRRVRNSGKIQDTICVNMFLDENNLLIPKVMQNLYTAHEVMQMKPIFVRDDMYQKFLLANKWIREYLPNAVNWGDIKILRYKDIKRGNGSLRFFPNIFESIAKFLQLWYMKKHRTTEIITDTLLAFHPNDQSKYVLEEFKKRVKKITNT